jgi:xanthine dehydrogenase accessory factor
MSSIKYDDVLESLAEQRQRRQAVVLVTVISKEGHGPAAPGVKMLVGADGRIAGTVGGGALEYKAVHTAQAMLSAAQADPLYETYDFGAEGEMLDPNAQTTGMICGGTASLFYERYSTGENLVVFGAGHIGRALARLLPGLGYNLTVIDSRREYIESFEGAAKCVCHEYTKSFADLSLQSNLRIIIATHSHDYDYQVLEQVMRACVYPQYVGVVASRKKRDLFFTRLKEAVPSADTSVIYMPAGLDIGGVTPEEIALSIASELSALRYSKSILKHMRE